MTSISTYTLNPAVIFPNSLGWVTQDHFDKKEESLSPGFHAISADGGGIVEKVDEMNALKVVGYIPLISVISGLFQVVIALQSIWAGDENMGTWDKTFLLIRGVVTVFQSGLIFLPIDAVVYVANNIFVANSKQSDDFEIIDVVR